MRKSLLAAIMAASAIVPAAAMAQDTTDRPHREGDARPQGRPDGARPAPAVRQQAPAAAARAPQVQAPAAQAQPQFRGGRPDAAAGGARGDYRGYQGRGGPPAQAQQQTQAQGRPDAGARGGDPRANGGPGGGYARGGDPRVNGGYRGGDPRANGGYRPDQRGGYDARGYAGGYNRGDGYNPNVARGWSRDWRQDNRYNYGAYRNQNRQAYHLPRYYAPQGWSYGYRRFSIGYTLNNFLFEQDYWIEDPAYYRLPPAYGPYRWVRYYNDALLVDIRTGYVVDTVYDIFW